MKEYLEIKKHTLSYHIERPFGERLKNSAKEHGYIGFFGPLRFLGRRASDYILQLMARIAPYTTWRVKFHKMRGVKIGRNVHIGPLCIIDDVYPNFCIIRDGASLAGYNIILTHYRPLEYFKDNFEAFVAPTEIGENAILAIGSIVLPGVKIGKGSVVAAGAVVTKDVPSHMLVGGVPAKIIRNLK
jgi:acetyltransferase-like isoleucine patch superfamily enzyme